MSHRRMNGRVGAVRGESFCYKSRAVFGKYLTRRTACILCFPVQKKMKYLILSEIAAINIYCHKLKQHYSQFFNKFCVIHKALCKVFVAIAKIELESCCTDV